MVGSTNENEFKYVKAIDMLRKMGLRTEVIQTDKQKNIGTPGIENCFLYKSEWNFAVSFTNSGLKL